ncbi:MAG TPA: hypothetical protein VGD97_08105 [Lacunisphaera sp.]
MFTILGADGKEYGPVPAAKIHEWINGGRANLSTKAKRVDEGVWKTLGEFAEFSAPPASAATPDAAPPPAASAAPDPSAGPVDAKVYAAELIARAAPLDIFGCLSRSFDLWKANLLPLVGVTFVVFLVTGALGAVPILGALVNIVLSGVFYGGLYYYYLGKMRGEPREFGDAFAGFSKAFGPLALASVFIVLLTMAAMCVLIAPWVILMMVTGQQGQPNPLLFLGIFVCVLPVMYLSIGWTFTFALVIDQGLSPWTAMEVSRRVVTKQWFRVFFTMLFGGILAMLGLIGLIIGVVFTIPLAVGALLYAYEDLCNPSPATTAN